MPERDRQVEARALLLDVGGGEVDRGAAHRRREAGVDERGHDAVLAFLHGGVGQADDDDLRIAVPGIDLDLNGIRIHPVDRPRPDLGEHPSPLAKKAGL